MGRRIALGLAALGLFVSTACNSPTGASIITTGLVTVTPPGLDFSAQAVGTPSTTQTVTLGNGLSSPVAISGIVTTGDFSQTTTCGATLPAKNTCTITVTFTPSAIGSRAGSLLINDNAAGSPQIVALTGSGGSGQVSVTPTSVTFSNIAIGTAVNLGVAFINNGSAPINISNITLVGDTDFTQTNTCTTAVVTSCIVSVRFSPTAVGLRSAKLVFADDASGSPHTVYVTGTGSANTPLVSLGQNALTFPAQAVGTSSRAASVQFQNLGGPVLVVSSITASGDFAQTNSCNLNLQNNQICTINVTFTPTAPGTRTGAITITDNAPGSPQVIVLTGAGTGGPSGPAATLSTSSLTFPNQPVGATSAPQPVTLTNSGTAALSIGGIAAGADFAQTNTCAASLAAGASCTINVTFTPGASGPRSGTLTISDGASGSPHTVLLSGNGTGGSTGPVGTFSPAALSFATEPIGAAAPALSTSFSNTGGAPLSITGISVEGDFSQTNTCPATLAAGASCTITVISTPTALGTRTGRIVVTGNGTNNPQTAVLTGTGGIGQVTLSAGSMTFTSQTVATTSAAQVATLTNSGTVPITVSNLVLTGDFAETDNCTGAVLQANGSCTINVTFTPSAGGQRLGLLTITDDAPGSPHTIVITGTGAS